MVLGDRARIARRWILEPIPANLPDALWGEAESSAGWRCHRCGRCGAHTWDRPASDVEIEFINRG